MTKEKTFRKVTRPEDDWGKAIGLAVGQSVEGTYIESRTVTLPDTNSTDPTATRDSLIYDLDADGEKLGVWGSFDLDERMAKVPAGAYVRITCVERIPLDGGREVKRFEVEVAE
jgi:hypothetical protein